MYQDPVGHWYSTTFTYYYVGNNNLAWVRVTSEPMTIQNSSKYLGLIVMKYSLRFLIGDRY